jgi:protein Tob/BTG
MKKEIQTAVDFLMRMVRVSCGSQKVDSDQLTNLRDMLTRMMETMYEHHWHPTNPVRGSGYRCIRINGMLDPLVKRAGEACGMSYESIRALFPAELTLWVDPDDVAYR